LLSAFAATTILASSSLAFADVSVTASTDLNVRAGPGPNYEIIGVIPANDMAIVTGCVEATRWCSVSLGTVEGWAFSDYLVADASGAAVVMSDSYVELGVPMVAYEGAVAVDPVIGALAAPVIVAGDVAGTAIVDLPPIVHSHIASHPVDNVYLDGEVVVGAAVPDMVELYPIPDYPYRYVYINDMPVLVNDEGQIVYIIRG
jgi:uncharacterized protein YraI